MGQLDRDYLEQLAAVLAAQERAAAARAWWHCLMFEMPKLSNDADIERREILEGLARRAMIQADIDLQRLQRPSEGLDAGQSRPTAPVSVPTVL